MLLCETITVVVTVAAPLGIDRSFRLKRLDNGESTTFSLRNRGGRKCDHYGKCWFSQILQIKKI